MIIYRISFAELIGKIRKNFDDDKIFLTIVAFQLDGKHYSVSTFASDNIEHLLGWTALMQAKLISGETIKAVSVVLRVFLPKNHEVEIKGKK